MKIHTKQGNICTKQEKYAGKHKFITRVDKTPTKMSEISSSKKLRKKEDKCNMTDRNEFYISQLSKMIEIPTISYYEKDVDEPFEEFQELLPTLFPSLFKTAEKELINGNLLLRWCGKSSEKPILLMNHHDVVSAQDEWKHDPFKAEVSEGRVWGRGTLDTKGGLWAMLQAADELCEAGYLPENDIYFFSSKNEETTLEGSKTTAAHLKKRNVRFDMILDEGGMILYEPISGAKEYFAMIGCGEKGYVDIEFTAKGDGGHSSCPEYDNSLVRLGKFMAEADRARIFDVELIKPVREMFRRMAPYVSGPLKTVYGNPELFAPVLKLVMPRLSAVSRALVQTTIAFTMASGAERSSIIPSKATICCNMRYSPHQGYKKSLEAIEKIASKHGLTMEVIYSTEEPKISEFECRQFKKIESAVKDVFAGKAVPAPYLMTGCSDAGNMYDLSDNIYHFTPFIIDSQQMGSIHGQDENVNTDCLIPAVEFYKHLMTN